MGGLSFDYKVGERTVGESKSFPSISIETSFRFSKLNYGNILKICEKLKQSSKFSSTALSSEAALNR